MRRALSFYSLLYKEVFRVWKVGFQTVLAPVLTALLYLLIFFACAGTACRGVSGGALHCLPYPGTDDDGNVAERFC